MSNLTIFTYGVFIFSAYMFFLLRMIWRQHNIQKKGESSSRPLRLDKNDEEKLAS